MTTDPGIKTEYTPWRYETRRTTPLLTVEPALYRVVKVRGVVEVHCTFSIQVGLQEDPHAPAMDGLLRLEAEALADQKNQNPNQP